MESTDVLIQIDFNKEFYDVLEDYKHNKALFTQEVEKTIMGYLGKKTIAKIIETTSIYPIEFFESYKDNTFYKKLRTHKAIDLLPEYPRFSSILLSERIVGKRFFDFLALIEQGDYKDEEMELDNRDNNNTLQKLFFENDKECIIHQVIDFIRVYLDTKLCIILENLKVLNLRNITYNALMLSEAQSSISGWVMEIILTKAKFFRGHRITTGYFEYNFHNKVHVSMTNPICDEMRIHFFKTILPNLSPEILCHHQAILNKDFKLSLNFIVLQKGEDTEVIELVFTIEGKKLSALRFLPKYKIHADHRKLLYEMCSSRPCVSKIKARAGSVVSDINKAMLNQFLIPAFLKTIDKKPRINPAYASQVKKSKLGAPKKGRKLTVRM